MNKEDLKSLKDKMTRCPFCNSDKHKITSISKGASKGSYYQGLCTKCYARGPKTSNPYDAVDKWNSQYLSSYIPEYNLDENQINRLINGDIVIKCDTQLKYNRLIFEIKKYCSNKNIKSAIVFWRIFEENTCICVNKIKDGYTYSYQSYDYFKKEGQKIEDLIITL